MVKYDEVNDGERFGRHDSNSRSDDKEKRWNDGGVSVSNVDPESPGVGVGVGRIVERVGGPDFRGSREKRCGFVECEFGDGAESSGGGVGESLFELCKVSLNLVNLVVEKYFPDTNQDVESTEKVEKEVERSHRCVVEEVVDEARQRGTEAEEASYLREPVH